MPNKSARYYMGKALTVLDWLRAGKSEELRECRKIDGRCAEIVAAQVETMNEIRHVLSAPEVLNTYFSWATKRENPMSKCPDLFKQLDRAECIGSVLNIQQVLYELGALLSNADKQNQIEALQKAIRFMEITNKFLSKDKAHDQMIKDRLEGD